MLRNTKELRGFAIQATDGMIGEVADLYFDDEDRPIRHMIVDTSNWWDGHHVLVAPQWIEAVSWPDAKVSVDLTRQAIKDAPPHDSTVQLDRQREQAIYEHYGRPGYWIGQAIQDAAK